jgi:hypothetical protein
MNCLRCGAESETEYCSLKCYDNHLILDKECRHTTVKANREKDIYFCLNCNTPLDDETKAKVQEILY